MAQYSHEEIAKHASWKLQLYGFEIIEFNGEKPTIQQFIGGWAAVWQHPKLKKHAIFGPYDFNTWRAENPEGCSFDIIVFEDCPGDLDDYDTAYGFSIEEAIHHCMNATSLEDLRKASPYNDY